jgi:hypothetical protein
MTTQSPQTVNTQTAPYLPRQRNFPSNNPEGLALEIDKAYVDIAARVNVKTNGLFAVNYQVTTGEQWYLNGQPKKQQTLRRVYSFGAIAAGTELDIPIGITGYTQFTRIYGTVITTMPDYRPLPYVDPITLTTGMGVLVGPVAGVQSIRIVVGATAPSVTSGLVVLEWLSAF